MSSTPRVIGIDADVARSSGLTEHPSSRNSRETLEKIKSCPNYKISLCSQLNNEWNEHASKLATKWKASMVASRRMVYYKDDDAGLRSADDSIRGKIAAFSGSSEIKVIANKDAHLVSLAVIGSKIIISNDKKARDSFYEILNGDQVNLNEMYWVSPTHEYDGICCIINKTSFYPADCVNYSVLSLCAKKSN